MLVLKEKSKKADINMEYYNVLDTETGSISAMSVADIAKSEIFGVVDSKAFVPISDYAWRLFDLVDSPVKVSNIVNKPLFNLASEYIIEENDIFVYYPLNVYPIDDNGIFWCIWGGGLRYFSIFVIYKFVFSLPIKYKPTNNVYLVSMGTYKLDMNEKAIKFMEKASVLC